MEKQRIILDDHASFVELRDLLEAGWERADVPYNPYGTEEIRLMELVRYTPEEKAAIEAAKAAMGRPPQLVDVNCLTVPIISYADEEAGKQNPYKMLAAKGWIEVHRTSSVAVMKLTDPRGVLLSDEDLEIIVENLRTYNPFDTTREEFRRQADLYHRLSSALEKDIEPPIPPQ